MPLVLSTATALSSLEDVVEDEQNNGEHTRRVQEQERAALQQVGEPGTAKVASAQRQVGADGGEADAQEGDGHDRGRKVQDQLEDQHQGEGAEGQASDGGGQIVESNASAVLLPVVAVVGLLASSTRGAGAVGDLGQSELPEGVHGICFL